MSTLHAATTRQHRITYKAIIQSTDFTTPGVLCCVQYAVALRIEEWCKMWSIYSAVAHLYSESVHKDGIEMAGH
jgi:hypothetical protein